MVGLPAPEIFAPIALRNCAKSTTSGSQAALSIIVTPSASVAQVPVPTPAAAPESPEAGARQHFDRALELYRAGHYAEALEQLKAAAKLDPDGKDLFFNLALVHEKLGQVPDAIAALSRFRELETDATERERADITHHHRRRISVVPQEAQRSGD